MEKWIFVSNTKHNQWDESAPKKHGRLASFTGKVCVGASSQSDKEAKKGVK